MLSDKEPRIVQGGADSSHSFVATDPSQIIGNWALHLVTELGGAWHSMGTAVLIDRCLALTARHILTACHRAYCFDEQAPGDLRGDFVMHAFQFGSDNEAREWKAVRIHENGRSDIAVAQVSCNPSWIPTVFPRLNLIPPRVGSRVAAFGYAGAVTVDGPNVHIDPGAHTSVGEVIDVFPGGRDRVLAPFPCFQVDARFDDSMSGGPVFDEHGALCGLISANIPPYEEGEPHASLVSLLWPLAEILVDAPWTERPPGTFYPMYDLLQGRGEAVRGLKRLVRLPDGTCGFRKG
jgi:S1-C subfamily serine protease